MPTSPRLHTDAETAAHLAHAAGSVLQHRIAQALPWRATEALLAVARQDPGLDPGAARDLVRAALVAVVTSEILAGREAQP